jgi:hypothetical protein
MQALRPALDGLDVESSGKVQPRVAALTTSDGKLLMLRVMTGPVALAAVQLAAPNDFHSSAGIRPMTLESFGPIAWSVHFHAKQWR